MRRSREDGGHSVDTMLADKGVVFSERAMGSAYSLSDQITHEARCHDNEKAIRAAE